MSELTNGKKLIIFYGMMKSGNHAIIKWVFENVLRQYATNDQINEMKLCYIENGRIGNALAFYNDVTLNPISPSYLIPCKVTMVSVEEEYSEFIPPSLKNENWESVIEVFIFRDLKNMISSRKNCREYNEKYFGTTVSMCKKWKELRKKALEIPNSIIVNYDELVSTGDSTLIEDLGIPKVLKFSDIPRIVSNNHKPGWSSFPGDENFNERYKKLDYDDSKFVDLFLEKNAKIQN